MENVFIFPFTIAAMMVLNAPKTFAILNWVDADLWPITPNAMMELPALRISAMLPKQSVSLFLEMSFVPMISPAPSMFVIPQLGANTSPLILDVEFLLFPVYLLNVELEKAAFH